MQTPQTGARAKRANGGSNHVGMVGKQELLLWSFGGAAQTSAVQLLNTFPWWVMHEAVL